MRLCLFWGLCVYAAAHLMSTELEAIGDQHLSRDASSGDVEPYEDAKGDGSTTRSTAEVNNTSNVVAGTDVDAESNADSASSFQWTAKSAILSIVLFVVAGVCEIGGGWMVWKAVREGKQFWWAIVGSLILIGYGFVPTLQPTSSFGRVYAVYGGFFIVLSFLWGWALDGDRPDIGDAVGGAVSLVGVVLILFWPR